MILKNKEISFPIMDNLKLLLLFWLKSKLSKVANDPCLLHCKIWVSNCWFTILFKGNNTISKIELKKIGDFTNTFSCFRAFIYPSSCVEKCEDSARLYRAKLVKNTQNSFSRDTMYQLHVTATVKNVLRNFYFRLQLHVLPIS